MITSPLEESYKTRFNVRPVRHALIVQRGSVGQLRRAFLDCCSTWGGISTPIIPVERNLSMDPGLEILMGVLRPDVVVSYLPVKSTTGQRRFNKLMGNLTGLLGPIGQHASDWVPDGFGCHVLSVLSEPELHRQLVVPRFVARKGEELALLALFGQIFPGQEADYATYVRPGPYPMGFDNLDFWQRQALSDPFSSPVNLTGRGLRSYEIANPFWESEAVYELVLGDDWDSLCLFWNLRAIRTATRLPGDALNRVLLVPARLMEDADSLGRLAAFMRANGPAPGIECSVEALAYGERETVSLFARSAAAAGFRRFKGSISMRRGSPSPETKRDPERDLLWLGPARVKVPESFKEGVDFETPRLLNLREGENVLRLEPPASFVNRFHQPVALDIESEVWGRFPKGPTAATAVDSNARWSNYGISLLVSLSATPSFFPIHIPDEWTALSSFFRDSDIDVRESVLSSWFAAVVRLAGGVPGLGTLASHLEYRIVESLAVGSSKKLAQRLIAELDLVGLPPEAVEDRLRNVGVTLDTRSAWKTAADLCSEIVGARIKEVVSSLERLSASGLLLRGLVIGCPECDVKDFHALDGLAGAVACPSCSARIRVPVEDPPGKGQEIRWSYSLNSLVNRAWDQDLGPVLTTVHAVAVGASSVTCVTTGLIMERAGKGIGDLDWVMLRDGVLAAGECKSGTAVGDKDLNTARVAVDAGVKRFVFSTVRDFAPESRARIDLLATELAGRARIDVLEGGQLLGAALD